MAKQQQSDEVISGEENAKRHEVSSANSKKVTIPVPSLGIVAGAVVIAAVGFASGQTYQKHHQSVTTDPASLSTNGGPTSTRGQRFGTTRQGSIGQVTAISDTSITVDDQRTSSSKTYVIDSSTSITSAGQKVAVSDIKSGDTVLIASADQKTATHILVNPDFGGQSLDQSGTSTAPAN